jgi:two-component system, OmpR family, phosphate regulon sensor histidine kinase PhoR
MKRSKFQLILLIITIVCLITLVGIQIGWVLRQAKLQEVQFNHSVEMALKRIENNLSKYRSCTESVKCSSCRLMTETLQQAANVDSIIKSDLNFYGIDLAFDYGIIDLRHENGITSNSTYITKNLAEKLQQSGYELKINFPKKRDFIIAQIGFIFITSMILVILLGVSFLLIYRYYRRERLLSDQIRDFINNMTHEFKTPLTNIGFANSMISKSEVVENDPKLSSYTGIIRAEQHKLKDRVEELLKASQREAVISTAVEQVDLLKETEDVVETFKPQIEEQEGTVSFTQMGDNFTFTSNTDQLHIIIGNLVDNAIKYSNKPLKIEITIKSTSDRLVLEITDNGIGISSEHLHRVFDNFYRVPHGDTHDTKGFGLGLYHVKTLVEKMGGRIIVSSTVGKGTTFTVEFPKSKTR